MKGNIRITGAIVFGVLLVIVVYINKPAGTEELVATATPVVAKHETRQYIEIEDSDGDGISDWEEQFATKIVAEDSSDGTLEGVEYTLPTTLTGQYALKLFQNRTAAGFNTQLSTEEKETLVTDTLASLQNPIRNLTYTPLDIQIIESSISALHDYGNTVSSILAVPLLTERDYELIVLQEVIQGIRPNFDDLEPIRITYGQLIQDLLLVPVPTPMVDRHLRAINLMQAVYEDIGVFKHAKTDPLLTLTYVRKYTADFEALTNSFLEMSDYLFGRGVRYTPDEPAWILQEAYSLNQRNY